MATSKNEIVGRREGREEAREVNEVKGVWLERVKRGRKKEK